MVNWQRLRMIRRGFIPADRWNALVDAVRSATVTSVVGGKLSRTPTGTTLTIDPRGGGAVSDPDHPWQVYATSGLDVRLIPGAVNAHVPSDIFAAQTLGASKEGAWLYLELTIDQRGNLEAVTIETADELPVAAEPAADGTLPTTLYYPLLAYDTGEASVTRIYQVATRNLALSVSTAQAGCANTYRQIEFAAV